MCHGRTNHSSEKADCESRVGEGRDDVTRRAAEKDGGWGEIGDWRIGELEIFARDVLVRGR